MPVKAFPFDKVEDHVENVFEAVIIAARRARQINEEQMVQVRTLMDGDESEGDELQINREELLDLEKLPKPVVTALEELVSRQIKHEYLEKEEK